MSQWTHVCGCIRYDAWIPEYPSLADVKTMIEKKGVPCGSDGALELVFWKNPDTSSITAYSVAVFGDLRDFEEGKVCGIKEWFEGITNNREFMVRNAILEICVEGVEDPIILRKEREG